MGRIKAKYAENSNANDEPVTERIDYEYDDPKNVTKVHSTKVLGSRYTETFIVDRDKFNRIQSELAAFGVPLFYEYDRKGRVKKVGLHDHKLTYTYNERDLIKQVDGPAGTAKYFYDPRDLVYRVELPAGYLIEYGRKHNGWISYIRFSDSGGYFQEHIYELNKVGDITSVTIRAPGEDNVVISYGHDKLHRLKWEEHREDNDTTRFEYDYDNSGRRMVYGMNGRTIHRYEYDEHGRLTRLLSGDRSSDFEFDYSPTGHVTRKQMVSMDNGMLLKFTYDRFQQPIRIECGKATGKSQELSTSKTVHLDFDHMGRRQKRFGPKADQGEAFLHFGDQRLVDLNYINRIFPLRFYHYGQNLWGATLFGEGGKSWLTFHDKVGSAVFFRSTADGSEVEKRYTAFGVARMLADLPVPAGFARGREEQYAPMPNSAWTQMGERVYDSQIGRFLMPDPLQVFDDIGLMEDPWGYALSRPTRYNDPSGMFFEELEQAANSVSGFVDSMVGMARDVGGAVQTGLDAFSDLAERTSNMLSATKRLNDNFDSVVDEFFDEADHLLDRVAGAGRELLDHVDDWLDESDEASTGRSTSSADNEGRSPRKPSAIPGWLREMMQPVEEWAIGSNVPRAGGDVGDVTEGRGLNQNGFSAASGFARPPAANPAVSEYFLDSEVSFLGSLVPVYGAGRSSIRQYRKGNYGWGSAYLLLAAADALLVGSLVKAVRVAGGIRASFSPGTVRMAYQKVPPKFHVTWESGGKVLHGGFTHQSTEAVPVANFIAENISERLGHIAHKVLDITVRPAYATEAVAIAKRTIASREITVLSTKMVEQTGFRAWSCVSALARALSRGYYHAPAYATSVATRQVMEMVDPDLSSRPPTVEAAAPVESGNRFVGTERNP